MTLVVTSLPPDQDMETGTFVCSVPDAQYRMQALARTVGSRHLDQCLAAIGGNWPVELLSMALCICSDRWLEPLDNLLPEIGVDQVKYLSEQFFEKNGLTPSWMALFRAAANKQAEVEAFAKCRFRLSAKTRRV